MNLLKIYIDTGVKICMWFQKLSKYFKSKPKKTQKKQVTWPDKVHKHLGLMSEAVSDRTEGTSANVVGRQPFRPGGSLPISDRPQASVQVEDPIGAGRWDLAWSQIRQVQLGLTDQQTEALCRCPDTDVNVTCQFWPQKNLVGFKSDPICITLFLNTHSFFWILHS